MTTQAIIDPNVPITPAGVVEAPPAVVPVTTPPVTTPAPPPPVDTEARQALAAAQAEIAHYRREAATGQLASKAAVYQNQLESDGWPRELAAIQAKTWLEKETAEAKVVEADNAQESYAKNEVARRLARDFDVPLDILMGYSDPRTMYAAAMRLGGESKRIAALEAEITALKGGTVAAQRFDPARGGPGSAGSSYKEALRNGGKLPTAAEIDAMTAKYLRG